MLTVTTTINKNIKTVWDVFTLPQHITNWYFASSDWHAPSSENNLIIGGKFKTRMEAKTDHLDSIFQECIPMSF